MTRIPNNAPPVKYTSTNPATNTVCIAVPEAHEFDAWGRPSSSSRTAPGMTASGVATLGIDTKSSPSPAPQGFQNSSQNGSTDAVGFKRKEGRAKRIDYQDFSRHLLTNEGKKAVARGELKYAANFHRTCKCLYVSVGKNTVNRDERGNAFYGGLPLCGSVWACPVCAAKIQERRRVEIADGMKWFYGNGYKAVMVTLTFPHKVWQGLADLLAKQAEALKLLRQNREWCEFKEAVGFQGFIRSLEVTVGENGWHPHTHELWFVNASADASLIARTALNRWFKCCVRVGLVDETDKAQVEAFYKYSVDVLDWASSSDYLAKQDDSRRWGIDREIARASTKAGKRSGRHPFALLDTADYGNRDAELFLEYVSAMKGKRQILWSRGMKGRVGIEEKDDSTLANEELEKSEVLATLTREEWKVVCKEEGRSELLDLAELQGYEGIAAWFARYGMSVQRGLLPEGMSDEGLSLDWKLNRAGLAAMANDDVLENHPNAADLLNYRPDSALDSLDPVKVACTKSELNDWKKKEARRKRDAEGPTKARSARDLLAALESV